jgi:hypothetical protein
MTIFDKENTWFRRYGKIGEIKLMMKWRYVFKRVITGLSIYFKTTICSITLKPLYFELHFP